MKLIKAENINDLLASGLTDDNIKDINNYMPMQKVTEVTFYGLYSTQQVLVAAKAAAFFGIPNVRFENCDLSKGALEVSKVLFSYPIKKLEFTYCKGIDAIPIAEAALESNSLEYIGFSGSLGYYVYNDSFYSKFNSSNKCSKIIDILSKSLKPTIYIDLSENLISQGHPEKDALRSQVASGNVEKVAYKTNMQSLLQEPDVIFHGITYEKGIINLIGQYADDACVVRMHCGDND
jgi:hypothetical protein